MEEHPVQHTPPEQEEHGAAAPASSDKQPWQDPKLTFVEPTLTKHGSLTGVTGGLFGTFTPTP
jgi:hypothetical protein